MDTFIKDKMSEYLSTHTFLRLATVSPEGRPMAHTLAYVSDGFTLYFSTNKHSRKAVNIMNNPFVSYVIDENDENIATVKGVQVDGEASIVTDEGELKKVEELLQKKFPFFKGAKSSPNICLCKVSPLIGWFLDYTVRFGNRDSVKFE